MERKGEGDPVYKVNKRQMKRRRRRLKTIKNEMGCATFAKEEEGA